MHLRLIGYVFAATGRRDDAMSTLKQMTSDRYGQVIVNMGLGEKDRALEGLERLAKSRPSAIPFVKVDPILDDLRTNARFRKVIKIVNLE